MQVLPPWCNLSAGTDNLKHLIPVLAQSSQIFLNIFLIMTCLKWYLYSFHNQKRQGEARRGEERCSAVTNFAGYLFCSLGNWRKSFINGSFYSISSTTWWFEDSSVQVNYKCGFWICGTLVVQPICMELMFTSYTTSIERWNIIILIAFNCSVSLNPIKLLSTPCANNMNIFCHIWWGTGIPISW